MTFKTSSNVSPSHKHLQLCVCNETVCVCIWLQSKFWLDQMCVFLHACNMRQLVWNSLPVPVCWCALTAQLQTGTELILYNTDWAKYHTHQLLHCSMSVFSQPRLKTSWVNWRRKFGRVFLNWRKSAKWSHWSWKFGINLRQRKRQSFSVKHLVAASC